MNLGQEIRGILPELRSQAEGRMFDQCSIGVETETTDPATLDVTRVVGDEHYQGKCRLSSNSSAITDESAGAQNFVTQQLILSIPAGSGLGVAVGDLVVYGPADPDTGDASLNGARLRIAGLTIGSQMTASRFPVERIS